MFTQIFTAALVALPFLAQSALAGSCVRTYTIQEGDICDSISAAKNVSTYQLAVINEGIINPTCTNLVPGTSICLGYSGEDCSTTYVVAAQDTCESITSKAGVNSTILSMNNPQINNDCSNIYVGEVLCTSPQVQVPPAPAGSVPATAIPSTATAAASATPTTKVSSTPVPSATAPPPVSTTPAPPPASTTPAPPPASSSQASGDDNGDDDDLPYCDEL